MAPVNGPKPERRGRRRLLARQIAAGLNLSVVVVGVIGLFTLGGGPPPAPTTSRPVFSGPEAITEEIARRLDRRDFAGVTEFFDDHLTSALPAAAIEPVWTNVSAQSGPLVAIGAVTIAPVGAHEVASSQLEFERTVWILRVTFDANARVAGLVIGPVASNAPPAEDLEATANAIADALSRGDFVAPTASFSETTRRLLDAARLESGWRAVEGLLGGFTSKGATTRTDAGPHVTITIRLEFERGPAELLTTFDEHRQVSGLFIRPA